MPLIIGALVAAFIGALRIFLPGIVGRLLFTLGIGFVTHKFVMPAIVGFVSSYIGRLPPYVSAYVGALGIDVAFVMVVSALIAVKVQNFTVEKLAGGAT